MSHEDLMNALARAGRTRGTAVAALDDMARASGSRWGVDEHGEFYFEKGEKTMIAKLYGFLKGLTPKGLAVILAVGLATGFATYYTLATGFATYYTRQGCRAATVGRPGMYLDAVPRQISSTSKRDPGDSRFQLKTYRFCMVTPDGKFLPDKCFTVTDKYWRKQQ